jgi:hypothetical protein
MHMTDANLQINRSWGQVFFHSGKDNLSRAKSDFWKREIFISPTLAAAQ